MQTQWAAENLQIIRTLMERSSIYRRALGPVMITGGAVGIVASVGASRIAALEENVTFILYWSGAAILVLLASFYLARREAIKTGEAFWTPALRRVLQALFPPLLLGALVTWGGFPHAPREFLPPFWMIFYGLALHSAGFFMPRGIKLFGLLTSLLGALFWCWMMRSNGPISADWMMGIGFGGSQLAYGLYLLITEKKHQPS